MNTPTPEYVFENQGSTPNTISQVEKLETFIVSYVDGQGKKQNRIVFRVFRLPEAPITYILQERINGQFVATAVNDWFHKALSKKIVSSEPVEPM